MKGMWGLLVFFVGALLPLQAAMNAQMNKSLGHPVWAGAWNFVVGLVTLLVVALAMGARLNSPSAVASSVPWWAPWGGFCGATLVVVGLMSVPRLGAALLMALLVAGQLSSSLLFDQMGWLGYEQRSITPGRLAGVALLGAGVWLIRRF